MQLQRALEIRPTHSSALHGISAHDVHHILRLRGEPPLRLCRKPCCSCSLHPCPCCRPLPPCACSGSHPWSSGLSLSSTPWIQSRTSLWSSGCWLGCQQRAEPSHPCPPPSSSPQALSAVPAAELMSYALHSF